MARFKRDNRMESAVSPFITRSLSLQLNDTYVIISDWACAFRLSLMANVVNIECEVNGSPRRNFVILNTHTNSPTSRCRQILRDRPEPRYEEVHRVSTRNLRRMRSVYPLGQ